MQHYIGVWPKSKGAFSIDGVGFVSADKTRENHFVGPEVPVSSVSELNSLQDAIRDVYVSGDLKALIKSGQVEMDVFRKKAKVVVKENSGQEPPEEKDPEKDLEPEAIEPESDGDQEDDSLDSSEDQSDPSSESGKSSNNRRRRGRR